MENKKEKSLAKGMFAHVDYETQRCQSMKEHADNVAEYAKNSCQIPELKQLVYLIGMLHDLGKAGSEIQTDFENILQNGDQVHKHGLDHSTAGGRMVREFMINPSAAEFASTAIYFHHGVSDCIDLGSGKSLQRSRREKEIEYDAIKEKFFQIYDKGMIKKCCEETASAYQYMEEQIKTFVKRYKSKCGNGYFFMGMYLRTVLSLLIDGDWTDTASFFADVLLPERISNEETQEIWKRCIKNFEQYLTNEIQKNPANGNLLNVFRQEISDSCRSAADTEQKLYRLTVPTGAGKTLSSLRFALYHAVQTQKQHIIYIAPYNSILEQNAEEIRKAVGDSSVVLEHHCNVISEDGEEERYRNLTETWDSPIIVTTAVQILNTLFSDQKSCIRRMHVLSNSIIIFDEVQDIPVKCTSLFHLAVNFLTQFCKTTVVLCSATQPTLIPFEKNNICECTEMAGLAEKYAPAFKRVEIVDATDMYDGKMEIEDLSNFAVEKVEEYQSVLIVVNTVSCALKVFEYLKRKYQDETILFHLSTNMCPQNRLDKLAEIKNTLLDHSQKVICVSTQLVEAGVNFSFGCVIRSMAGLDNVIQAAGRCNRHKEFGKLGAVYIVKMSEDAEKLTYLKEIQNAQNALQKVLDDFRQNPEKYKGTLDSEEAVKAYYWNYYHFQLEEKIIEYPAGKCGANTTLVELLGANNVGRKQYERTYGEKAKTKLPQAFQTAGQAFEVIGDTHKINIIVPYNEEAKRLIDELSMADVRSGVCKKILRKLQRYTVGISATKRDKLNNAIYTLCDNEVLVLCEGYYDEDIGVIEDPKMETNFM